jgi:ABC-type bacteriocin/lantibiotic exporter with double-glycine peptidase domain
MIMMMVVMIVIVVMIVVVVVVMMFMIAVMAVIVMIVFARKRRHWKQRGRYYRANQSKLAEHLGGPPSCRQTSNSGTGLSHKINRHMLRPLGGELTHSSWPRGAPWAFVV